jgi:HEAT repeat protein
MDTRPPLWNGVQVPYGRSVEELDRLVNGREPVRWAAFVALAHHSSDAAIAVLRKQAGSNDPHVRRIAVEAIGIHPNGHFAARVACDLLCDSYAFVVRSACEAAARQQIAQAHNLIVRLLGVDDEATRETALRSVGPLWQDTDLQRVIRISRSDSSERVRRQAAWTLRAAASPTNWKSLFALWSVDSLPRHRVWACDLAGQFGNHHILRELRRLAEDFDGHVRYHAKQAIVSVENRIEQSLR